MRAFDRGHALELVRAGVDYQIRETFESAMVFGEAALLRLGVVPKTRPRPSRMCAGATRERFDLQIAGDIMSGNALSQGQHADPDAAVSSRARPAVR